MSTTSDSWLQTIASDAILDLAYCWLCKRRAKTSHNNEVWFLRARWAEVKPQPSHLLQNKGERAAGAVARRS
jgi:hypothetical protein